MRGSLLLGAGCGLGRRGRTRGRLGGFGLCLLGVFLGLLRCFLLGLGFLGFPGLFLGLGLLFGFLPGLGFRLGVLLVFLRGRGGCGDLRRGRLVFFLFGLGSGLFLFLFFLLGRRDALEGRAVDRQALGGELGCIAFTHAL